LGAWEPTKDQQLGPRLVSAWYTLLNDAEEEDDDRRHRRVTPWTRLLADVVLPRLTEWFNREWNVRDAAAGLSLIAAWEDVLPLEARDLVIENSLLPRLRREVERWNPTKDPQPLSQWLVPWRVVLGPRLHELGLVLKPTLLNALTAWHPADQSALALLRPLRPVWDQHAWESLLVRVILPKLSLAMREFIINPQQQVIDGFQWVINWHDLVPPHLFIPIFEFEFFPKWFNVLHLWLSTAPNYEEVMRWYLNWKKMFPEQLQSHERIRDKFNYALELMNAVLSNSPLPPLDVTRIQPPVPIQAPKVEPAVAAPVKRVPLSEALTFREMIERLADDNGLGFVPTKKQHDGKPIYMFGSVPIIVDKDLILTQVGGQWRPSSIEALLKQVQ
jgi:tuftelin-interacting protein 11